MTLDQGDIMTQLVPYTSLRDVNTHPEKDAKASSMINTVPARAKASPSDRVAWIRLPRKCF